MSRYYPTTLVRPVIGTKDEETKALTGVDLTTAYQAENDAGTTPTQTFEVGGFVNMNLDVVYTMGSGESGNSIEVQIESSTDGVNFTPLATDSTTGGTSTLTAREFTFVGTNADTAAIPIFIEIGYKNLRVSCKETGVVTNAGNVFVEATLSGQ